MSSEVTTSTAARTAPTLNWRTASFILLGLALAISGYLSYVKLTDVAMACVGGGAFNCSVVQNSRYAELAGIPVAWFGLATNLVLLGLLLAWDRGSLMQDNGPILYFGVLLIATLFSIWLIVVQAFILRAYCPWCLAHEAVVFGMFGIASVQLKRHLEAD